MMIPTSERRCGTCSAIADSSFWRQQPANRPSCCSTEHEPDVILLDLNLPDVSGLDVLIELTKTRSTPVIVLSGRTGETDRVVGLDLGADDYITKPFAARELVARVNAAIRRRCGPDDTSELAFGDLVIDEATHDVTVDGALVALTAQGVRCALVLGALHLDECSAGPNCSNTCGGIRASGKTTRRSPNTSIGFAASSNDDDRNRWIETVRGVGYRFAPSG